MTVSYTADVANAKGFGCFLKLLFRWRGSIYKLVWPDLFVFLSTYFSLSFIYRVLLNAEERVIFERIAIYCEKYGTLIPVSFVLGFYVSFVMGRWWAQYQAIPRIDTLAIWLNSALVGEGEKERLLRRTIMRYTCLTIIQCFTLISPRVKKRFPTLDHLVEAGVLLEGEKNIMGSINSNIPREPTHWIPIVWATSIVTRARREDKLKNDSVVKSIIDEINKIKDQCFLLLSFDLISVPLVYTQVVTLSVYTYFFSCIMGRQWVYTKAGQGGAGKYGVEELDLFIPVFTILQFLFYMGWLKVAESLLNPFGEDDDDFELNWLIDRNLKVAYLIVDEMHHDHPELLKDQYWDEVVPEDLPHTVASDAYKELPPESSTANIFLTKTESELVPAPSSRSINDSNCKDYPDTPSTLHKNYSISSRRPRYSSTRSNSSMASTRKGSSIAGSRISIFKRLLSREKSSNLPTTQLGVPLDAAHGLSGSGDVFGSNTGLNDVIMEVDENSATVISMKNEVKKPTVQEIFRKIEEEDKKNSDNNEDSIQLSNLGCEKEELLPIKIEENK